MKRALKSLLQKLEEIENEHDGLGDTDVRDHMSEHVRRVFLRPEIGFEPDGEYGLDPVANRKVSAALTAFCKAAEAAAQRLGLTTFAQRVAAFQDSDVVTPSGADYNDYFGVIELDQGGGQGKELGKNKTQKPVQRAYVFDRPGTLDDLLEAFKQQGNWSWQATGGGAEDPYLESRPEPGSRVRVREGLEKMDANGKVRPPEHGFMALLEAGPDQIDNFDATFRRIIDEAAAKNVVEKSSYWW